MYQLITRALTDWPLARRRVALTTHLKVGYYYYRFPVPSETFIVREIAALERAGIAVQVYAHERVPPENLGADAQAMARTTRYFLPMERRRLWAFRLRFARRLPLTLINLLLYNVGRRNLEHKKLRRDWTHFNWSIYLAGLMEEDGITHVHVPWAKLDADIALMAANLLGIPYTVQARASDLHRHRAKIGLQERLRQAEYVLTNAEFNRSIIAGVIDANGSAPPIVHFYEGLDFRQFPRSERDSSIVAPIYRILCVGRMIPAKGFDHLLRACALLKERGMRFECTVIGGPSNDHPNYGEVIDELRTKLALEKDVHLHGGMSVDQVVQQYRHADVFVLPAVVDVDGTGDVTPNVVIEAMAMGVPVISTRQRGIPELVADGVTGLLVPPGDVEALAAALEQLANDPPLRLEMGRQGRARAEARFDIDKNIGALVDVFRTCHRASASAVGGQG